MGNICCIFAQEHPVERHTLLTHEAVADELSSSQTQISIQCTENPEGHDGMMVFDTEAIPMVNILCPTSRGSAGNSGPCALSLLSPQSPSSVNLGIFRI
ncbi:hypothetical protein Q8A67_022927 [Cirrhinus molitorella]|uniref:Uncharacterized protein n=1 Tax=Cirrhinus molitorella TaxID=172907 RepID=A0AA88P604_9TELE|nr:hypothetical protein Q8A67_022927 [Cirrhinus molitorella]